MKFHPIASTVPGMLVWRAERGDMTFVISQDTYFGDAIQASVKPRGARPFDGTLHDLGVFASHADAARACEMFGRERRQ